MGSLSNDTYSVGVREEFVVDLRKSTKKDIDGFIDLSKKLFRFNHTMPYTDEYMEAIRDIFGDRFGEGSYIVAPISLVCASNMVLPPYDLASSTPMADFPEPVAP